MYFITATVTLTGK